ncbi:MAG TPA: BREX-1 system adenine-specific DNA-methyltransferase PglX [Thermoanaerobaculia bacterium]|nr:BREX-1 system adenine-specific DNA-methyltransferase PglX [Thermoanaerobaculia bacterium]
MDKDTRNAIERATQRARKLLEDDFASQLEGTFDVLRSGTVAPKAGSHLTPRQVAQRDKIVAAIEHKRVAGMSAADAVADYLRDAAFTTLNRFVALKMLEARELVQECITKGEQSAGYREFTQDTGTSRNGVAQLPESAGYRLYIECLFDELSTEVKVLFDRRDPASVLWPRRTTFGDLLTILNATEIASVWEEDETIGWVYQFFNSKEERAAMRDAKQGGSQAPRNSRELAVRNQFFTPRYVVEFLVDNTLGRTWRQMQGNESSLAEQCRYFVRGEEETTRARPRKDPRDLRILDPACGSGHFLLYCFDLLLTIYEEAWAAKAQRVRSQATGRTIQEDYLDLGDLRRATPALILEHNLHGVDIDPRATQIAALSLWLRAQRAWKDFRVPPTDRPPVRRTHLIVAEPMPGNTALVEEFAERLNPALLRDLFRKMVSEMRLAGELGTLIPVEEGIVAELRLARDLFVKQRQSTGFLPGMEPVRKQGELDLSGIDDDRFFHEAEANIVEALRHFAEAAANGTSVRRQLFVGDTAQGIALIDLLRTRFDIVLMNPPFGAASLAAKKEFEKAYPRTKNDIFAAFVERGIGLLHPHGLLGAITSRTGFFLSSFRRWREEILLREAPPTVFADLGLGVMDAALVEAAAYCLEKGSERDGKTVFLRALEELHNKQAVLHAAIHKPETALGFQRFEVAPETFSSIPGSPFAYWVSDRLRGLFKELPAFESEGRLARQGLATAYDFRFVRAWWEIPQKQSALWPPFAKGGRYSPFYFDLHLVVHRSEEDEELDAFPGSVVRNPDHYFRPGLTWPLRTKSDLSMRVMPRGCVFGHKGPAAFVEDNDYAELLSLLAIGNSRAFRALVEIQLAAAEPTGRGGVARSYEVGVMQRTPIPRLTKTNRADLGRLAQSAWSIKRSLDSRIETSHAFTLPGLLQVAGTDVVSRTTAWSKRVRESEAELAAIHIDIDERCFSLYGIHEMDRQAITTDLSRISSTSSSDDTGDSDEDDDNEDEVESISDAKSLSADLVSWAVGVAFGRFDIRLAAGSRPNPSDPEPFEPLPDVAPGMLTEADSIQFATSPDYPIAIPRSGILVDDPGHQEDLTACVHKVFDVTFDVASGRWWSDVAKLLDPKGHDLRAWLAGNFFEYHLSRHSKSRRKAPILWQLCVPSGRYSVWLYAHCLTPDSFFQLQSEVVGPKLSHEERKLTSMSQSAGDNPAASARKELAAQEVIVEELRVMFAEVKRIAPLWNPNLDDGVVLMMAPLWRLVGLCKPWQKELKAKWDELAAEKYDWAHLAMHLWPERVVPKCATDRSLAIAHGLEDVFWVQGSNGRWTARMTPTRPVEELVGERTSSAVKAALKSLLEAPVAQRGSGRGGRRRAAASADEGGSR